MLLSQYNPLPFADSFHQAFGLYLLRLIFIFSFARPLVDLHPSNPSMAMEGYHDLRWNIDGFVIWSFGIEY